MESCLAGGRKRDSSPPPLESCEAGGTPADAQPSSFGVLRSRRDCNATERLAANKM